MCHESLGPGERWREGAKLKYFNFLNIQTTAYTDKDEIIENLKKWLIYENHREVQTKGQPKNARYAYYLDADC